MRWATGRSDPPARSLVQSTDSCRATAHGSLASPILGIVSCRWAVVLAFAVGGCRAEGDDPTQPADDTAPSFVSYHSLREAEHIEPTAEGYAVLGGRGLAAYDADDQAQWTMDTTGLPLSLGRTVDGVALRMASAAQGQVRLDRVKLDGTADAPVELVDLEGPLDEPQVVFREDGGAWIHGGRWPSFWQGQVLPDGTLQVERSEAEERRDLLALAGDQAFALRSTWASEFELVELQRLSPDGSAQWTVTVHDGSHDATGAFELDGTLGPDGRGGVLVMTVRDNLVDPPKTIVRSYDADGELQWTRDEPVTGTTVPRALTRPGLAGGAVWLEQTDGGQLVVRLVDPAGETTDEAEFDGNGTPVVDATFIDDTLHVLTRGGLTRIYVPPLELPPVM